MTERYDAPTVVDLGRFQDETGFGIGGQAEGWNPIADRKS